MTPESKEEIIDRMNSGKTLKPLFHERVHQLTDELVDDDRFSEDQFRLLLLLSGTKLTDMFIMDADQQKASVIRSAKRNATLKDHKHALMQHVRQKHRVVQVVRGDKKGASDSTRDVVITEKSSTRKHKGRGGAPIELHENDYEYHNSDLNSKGCWIPNDRHSKIYIVVNSKKWGGRNYKIYDLSTINNFNNVTFGPNKTAQLQQYIPASLEELKGILIKAVLRIGVDGPVRETLKNSFKSIFCSDEQVTCAISAVELAYSQGNIFTATAAAGQAQATQQANVNHMRAQRYDLTEERVKRTLTTLHQLCSGAGSLNAVENGALNLLQGQAFVHAVSHEVNADRARDVTDDYLLSGIKSSGQSQNKTITTMLKKAVEDTFKYGIDTVKKNPTESILALAIIFLYFFQNTFIWRPLGVKYFGKNAKLHRKLQEYDLERHTDALIRRGYTLDRLQDIDSSSQIDRLMKRLHMHSSGRYGDERYRFVSLVHNEELEEEEEDNDRDDSIGIPHTQTRKTTSRPFVSAYSSRAGDPRRELTWYDIFRDVATMGVRFTVPVALAFYVATSVMSKRGTLPAPFTRLANQEFMRLYNNPVHCKALTTRDIKRDSEPVPYSGQLERVDTALHELFATHSDVDRLRYALLKRFASQSTSRGRRVMPLHILRTDGGVRESAGEIARAIKHHCDKANRVGATRSRIAANVRTTKRKFTRHSSSSNGRRYTRKTLV